LRVREPGDIGFDLGGRLNQDGLSPWQPLRAETPRGRGRAGKGRDFLAQQKGPVNRDRPPN